MNSSSLASSLTTILWVSSFILAILHWLQPGLFPPFITVCLTVIAAGATVWLLSQSSDSV